jgi:hypothetical protein
MFESDTILFLRNVSLALAVTGHLTKWVLESDLATLIAPPRLQGTEVGEYGGDLGFLRRCYTGPVAAGESNHYLDLWAPGALPLLARVNGLTNNRALIVDSHGNAACAGRAYGFCPKETLLQPGQKLPWFSAADLARVLGPQNAATIHNILLAGCNAEGRFRSQELRRYFVNATNITYMTPGQLAFKPMFYQAIVLPSSQIRLLYGKRRDTLDGRIECALVDEPGRGAQPLGIYLADLYRPGGRKPYRTLKAGRELLEGECAKPGSLRADMRSRTAQP